MILLCQRSQIRLSPLALSLNFTAVLMERHLPRERTLLAAPQTLVSRDAISPSMVVVQIGVPLLPAPMVKAVLLVLVNLLAAVRTMRLPLMALRAKAAASILHSAAALTTFGLHMGLTLKAASVELLHMAAVRIKRLPHVDHNRRAVHARPLNMVVVPIKSPLPEDPNLKAVRASQCSLVAVQMVFPLLRVRITRDVTVHSQNSNVVRMVRHQLKVLTLRAALVWRPNSVAVQMVLQKLRMISLAAVKTFSSPHKRLVVCPRNREPAATSALNITLIRLMEVVLDSGMAAVRVMVIVLRLRRTVRTRARSTLDSMCACCLRAPVPVKVIPRNGTSIQTVIVAKSSNMADVMAPIIGSTVLNSARLLVP